MFPSPFSGGTVKTECVTAGPEAEAFMLAAKFSRSRYSIDSIDAVGEQRRELKINKAATKAKATKRSLIRQAISTLTFENVVAI